MCHNAQFVWYYFLYEEVWIARFSYLHQCNFKQIIYGYFKKANRNIMRRKKNILYPSQVGILK